ncbi:multidrug effflux MFS transporter [Pasteurellaceae bacterium LIM206]|nr:multidrug effflux MFS transporter [Pasteurellaceae bacterium LIM206]
MTKRTNSKAFLVILLGVLSAFGPFVVDLYLPALPQLSAYFQASTSLTQLSLTSAMFGLAAGQLLLGPISDKFGRKAPLLISLFIYIISTICLVFAGSMESFVFFRCVQGLSSAGSVVISRAVATDLYRGREMARFFGLLMAINSIAPIISPVLGGVLAQSFQWRGIFVFLALLGVVVFAFCLNLKESLIVERRLQTSIFASFTVFRHIFKNKAFMAYVMLMSFLLTAMFAYIAASPFILQTGYGLSTLAYSLLFGVNGAAIAAGSGFAGKLSPHKALVIGIYGFAVSAAYTVFVLLTHANVWLVELGFFTMLLFTGINLPPISALAMESERRYAGSASALLGFMPFFFGGIVSPLVGLGDIFISSSAAVTATVILVLLTYGAAKHHAAGAMKND